MIDFFSDMESKLNFFTHGMGAVRGLQLKVLIIPSLACDQEQLLQ